jgi:hypothetical protein
LGSREWRIKIKGQPWQKVQETTSQPIKAGQGGMHLSSHLLKKHKEVDHNPGHPRYKHEILLEK